MTYHETPEYKVLEKDGAFEIRFYESYLTAAVKETSIREVSRFGEIFDYINGSNS